jgi:tetratricopeptide (TPR) repeat protein
VAGGHHQKLFDLYVMGKYEECLGKAQSMTENDKYSNDSEPYLWVSMCFFKFVGDEEMMAFYPNSAKDALKFGVKFKKKDDKIRSKEGDYLFDANEEFMYDLIEMALVEAKSFLAMDNYSKSSYFYKLASQLDPENKECSMINGVVFMLNRNIKEGQLIVNDAMAYYKEKAQEGGYKPHEKTYNAFEDGFIYYANYLKSKGNSGEAFEVMALAVKLDPKNKKFIALYKELS